MAVFDSAFLVLLFDPEATPPNDPATGKPVAHAKERIEHLVDTMGKQKDKVIIPTPVLSEYLVKADEAGAERLQLLEKRAVFDIASFDKRAAVELAATTREVLGGDKRSGVDAPYQKVKIDRQIVAIAKVTGADTIYSNDASLAAFAEQAGIKVFSVDQLRLPPEDAQRNLDLEKPDGE